MRSIRKTNPETKDESRRNWVWFTEEEKLALLDEAIDGAYNHEDLTYRNILRSQLKRNRWRRAAVWQSGW